MSNDEVERRKIARSRLHKRRRAGDALDGTAGTKNVDVSRSGTMFRRGCAARIKGCWFCCSLARSLERDSRRGATFDSLGMQSDSCPAEDCTPPLAKLDTTLMTRDA